MICDYCNKEFGDEFESRPYCENQDCEEKHYAQSDGRIYADHSKITDEQKQATMGEASQDVRLKGGSNGN